MKRFLLGLVVVIVAIWLVAALISAIKGIMYLALVVAILIVGYNLLNILLQPSNDGD